MEAENGVVWLVLNPDEEVVAIFYSGIEAAKCAKFWTDYEDVDGEEYVVQCWGVRDCFKDE